MQVRLILIVLFAGFSSASASLAESQFPITDAAVVLEGKKVPGLETAAQVLIEEVEQRTGKHLELVRKLPASGPAIVLALNTREMAPEGFRVEFLQKSGVMRMEIRGADARGVLFGVGYVLRQAHWQQGVAQVGTNIQTNSSPRYQMRGHQLGYRARANSWDAWTAEQFDQHIRELALFGSNCIENIPFQDDDPSPHFKMSREEMNRVLSEICEKYDQDYWVWTPADFDLKDNAKREEALKKHEEFYKDCPRLDAVFFPGGDPGDNHPSLVMPFLADISRLLHKHHPKAGVWISLQGFNEEQVDYFYQWLKDNEPKWLAGLVSGPSSPDIAQSRKRLPEQYQHRHYPDITHVVRAQYPLLWLDQAIALTLGREPVNPTPNYQVLIHNTYAPHTDGFLSYSDGVHDDVNKIVWSQMGWEPVKPVRDVLVEYCNFFFGSAVAEDAADGILALERNWEGSLKENGGVGATLELWQRMTREHPELEKNWRWQMCLMRAYYDAYTRHRLIYEQELEERANRILLSDNFESGSAMETALVMLQSADTHKTHPELREQVVKLCDDLFASIGLQTSVERHHASGAERGAVLDFLDYPLNNRWWLEDEFKKVRELPEESAKRARLMELASWEDPGPGGFFDDIGNVANAPRTVRGEALNTLPPITTGNIPTYWWWENGMSRQRLSWQVTQDWPDAMRYEHLDANAEYLLRMTGYGQFLVVADGQRLAPTPERKEIGEIAEIPVPTALTQDGTLEVTFERPDERGKNWREQSRLAELWLIKVR